MKIVVVFPTVDEKRYFQRDDVIVEHCGVGLIASAYNTLKIIDKHKPDIIIMAGIAGVYDTSPFKIGDKLLVRTERISDMGFFFEDGFKDFSQMKLDMSFDSNIVLDTPYHSSKLPFEWAVSNSMNCSMAPFISHQGVDIENMEGSAFFWVCLKEGVRFYELRTVSNVVDLGREDWDFETSIRNLAEGLNTLIDTLKNEA